MMDTLNPIDKLRAHVDAHKNKERAMFSIAGLQACLDELDRRAPVAVSAAMVETIRAIVDEAMNSAIPEPWEVSKHAAERIMAALSPSEGVGQPTHRHKKRGTEYVLLGFGKMQSEHWYEQTAPTNVTDSGLRNVDMREVAIYRGHDRQLWVRPREEFEDGRFEPLPTKPVPGDE